MAHHGGALALERGHLDPAAMQLDEALDQAEAQAGAAVPAELGRTLEALEHARLVGLGDADAVILEAEAAADTATKRLATLKALRTALRGYDMAVTVLIEQPAPLNPIANPEERKHELP